MDETRWAIRGSGLFARNYISTNFSNKYLWTREDSRIRWFSSAAEAATWARHSEWVVVSESEVLADLVMDALWETRGEAEEAKEEAQG